MAVGVQGNKNTSVTGIDFDVIIVGAGFAGMYMLHRMRGMGLKAIVFEAGSGVGGTWFWNRYPGARCDVESVQYSYQFDKELEQEWTWSEKYSPQPEILKYANHVADRFKLREHICFNTRIKSSIYELRQDLLVGQLKEDLEESSSISSPYQDDYFFDKVSNSINEAPSWLPKANFSRTQTDLIARNESGEEVVFVDYFTNFDPPSIQTENGLLLKGSLLKALAGSLTPGQYAQAAEGGALSIGEVSTVNGTVNATRLDGTAVQLGSGDPVFQGDTIETVGNGSVGLVFLDKTTLSLSEGGKMVLDELVYDPASGTGSMAVDMVEGAFSFISGEIAKTGPDSMKISTPVATVGIRGTTVAGKAAVEGNENSFTLLQDADGGVGQISVSNAGGTQVLGQVGATTTVTSFNAAPPPPVILSAAEIQANYGTALNVLPPTPAVAPNLNRHHHRKKNNKKNSK